MFKNATTLFALLVSLVAFGSQAQAVTIAGVEYDKILSFNTEKSSDRLGFWTTMSKFYTYDNVANSAIGTDNVNVFDTALNGFNVGEVYFMGTSNTAQFDSTIKTGVVQLFDTQGALLIGGSYASNGVIDSTRSNGTAGQLNITGLFSVNAGKLHDLGLVTGPLYVEFLFDRVVGLGGGDIHTSDGTINFYTPTGGASVPEPGTLALLAASLFGMTKVRRRKSAE